jgi:UDP-glucose 6-dehydrogenase
VGLLLGTENNEVAAKCSGVFTNIIPADTPVHQVSATTSEILKIASNCYGTIRINFFNMLGQILIKSGLDHDLNKSDAYLSGVDRRKGNLRFGFGYGGPCYPRDNWAFANFIESIDMKYPYGEINDQFNNEHVDFLTDYFLRTNTDSVPFYFAYISYKPGVRIFEESHQLAVCRNLLAKGAQIFVEPTQFIDPDIATGMEHRPSGQDQAHMPPAVPGAIKKSKVTRPGLPQQGNGRALFHLVDAIPPHRDALVGEETLDQS